MRTIVATLCVLGLCASAFAQEKKSVSDLIAALQKLDGRVFKPDSADAKLRADTQRQLRDDVNKRDVEAWRAVKTKADWEKMRDGRIALLRESLGTFPPPPKQVKVVTTKKLPGDGFTIENIIYETRPNFYVTANLYVPEKTAQPMPGFIVIHSHHNPKTQGELQDMGMIWARQGCLVLIPDMLGHGERRQHPFVNAKSYPETYPTSRQDYHFRYNTALQLHAVGDSLMGWMVWDLMRGVDVLYQRPNLDKSKLMVFGSVAGGGDPCAVFAALEPRVTAAAPFNFGGPQPETKFPLPEDAELAFNYMGGGSWESTRGLRLGARDGFQAWVIVASLAPRGLIYGHEFAWDEKNDPVWTRFNKIWGFYDAKDKLASAKGRGSVKGKAPESTHCNNIGFEHRKPIYPTLNRWFGLPVPEENKKRFDASELQCWTDEARDMLKPRMMHELMRERAAASLQVKAGKEDQKAEWLRLLGITEQSLALAKCKVEEVGAEVLPSGHRMKTQILRHESNPVLALPMVTLRPMNAPKNTPIVIGVAQDGKAGFLKNRAETIAQLLNSGVAVCLPDLRGTGETRVDGRGRTSGSTSVSATEYLHGRTVPGTQLQELVMLIHELPKQGFGSVALWGDSFAAPNDPQMVFATPHDAAKMPKQSEPMGGLLALLGGVFGGDNVKAIYVRGGLVSFRSMLDSPFCYYPHDAVIPGVLASRDLDSLASANGKRGLRMESLVDGLNRQVDQKTLTKAFERAKVQMVLSEQASAPTDIATWLAAQVKR